MRNRHTLLESCVVIHAFDSKEQVFRECLIDSADLPIAQSISGTWFAHKVRGKQRKWYAQSKVWRPEGARTVLLHRLILGLTDPDIEADHRDNDGLNNRRSNLRPCTHKENLRFRQPDKDWTAYDNVREMLNEYRKEKEVAKGVGLHFGLTRQGVYAIRRGKTKESEAAITYRNHCMIRGIRQYHEMQRDRPVLNSRWGVVNVQAAR